MSLTQWFIILNLYSLIACSDDFQCPHGILPISSLSENMEFIMSTNVLRYDEIGTFFLHIGNDADCTIYKIIFDNFPKVFVHREYQGERKDSLLLDKVAFYYNKSTSFYDYTWKDDNNSYRSDSGYTLSWITPNKSLMVYKCKPNYRATFGEVFVVFTETKNRFNINLSEDWSDIVNQCLRAIPPSKESEKYFFDKCYQKYERFCAPKGSFTVFVANDAMKMLLVWVLFWILVLLVFAICKININIFFKQGNAVYPFVN